MLGLAIMFVEGFSGFKRCQVFPVYIDALVWRLH
jgi:hypothetical protein